VRDAEARLVRSPRRSSSGHRRVEVAHPADQHRRISLQVLGQQQAGPAACQPHLRDARAEGLDGEGTSAPMTPVLKARSRSTSRLGM
jgi:hypothetical protein